MATGTYTLTARAFDNVGGHGVSAPVTITVGFPNNLKPVVDLTSPASGSVFDLADQVTLLADASDPDGTVGRVDFYVDSQLVGTDDSSPYAAIWTTALSGSHNLTAVAVDDLGAATTSAPIIVSVVAGGVSVNVALAANGATATASSTYHSGYPAGAAIDGRRSGAIRGQLGTWEDSTDAVPDWLQIDFAAPYAIDEVHVFSMQENWMAPLEPTPVLTSYLAAEDFEVQYWNGAAWVVVPGGQVVGSTRVWARVHFAPVTTSAVRIVVTKVAGGRTRLSEVEVYREGFANTLPSVELLSPAGGSSFTAPVTIQLQASASDPDGSVTQVAFYADGQQIGTDTTSPYETTWPDVTAGTYAITVTATDDSGNTRTSLPATVSVTNQPNVPPMVSLTAPGSGSVFAVADAVALRATASDPNGTVARVDFFAGALPIGSDPTSPYEVTWTAGPVGPYSLTAVAVDNLNLATTSTAVPVSVVAAGARVNVALAANGATATASSTYTTDYAARAAIDGRRSGAIRGQLGTWEDAGALLPDWFQVTFAAPSSIDQVNIFSMQVAWAAPVEPTPTLTSGLAAENFDIQYWNGADWVVVPGGQVVGNTLVWKQVSFAPITTSALRIAVTKVAGGITRLTEVEAWTAASGVSPPVATLTASPSTIAPGGAATLSWTTSGAASVAIDQGVGAVVPSGSTGVTPAATTTYTLTATNASGATTATAVVTVNVPPVATLTVSPSTITPGGAATLAWTTSGAASVAIDQGVGAVVPSGSTGVTPAATTTYTLTATNAGGVTTATAVVTVNVPPVATLTASPSTIAAGGAATLSWTTSGAASVAIDQGVGAVVPSGSTGVTPTATTTYTLTATNAGGATTATAVVTVNVPPVATLTVSPSTIAAGGAATLSWTTSGAASVAIDQGVGAVVPSGSTGVTPTATTTYTLTATNASGATTATAVVTVNVPPVATLTVSPSTITPGGAATLAWTTSGAASVAIDQGVGAVVPSGSTGVTPAATTTYTLTATNASGVTTATAVVTVNVPPVATLTVSPSTIAPGGAATLAWTTSGAASVAIDQGVGAVVPSGSTGVTPAATTTYTLTATNAGGATTATAVVTVNVPPVATLTVSPSTITPGGAATLSWTTSGAASVAIDQGVGAVVPSGSTGVTPAATTTYTLAATNASGVTTATAVVTVNVPPANVPPMVSLTAPGSGSVFTVADAVALRATASDPNGTVARVDFFAGALPIGSDPTSPYEVTWTAGPVGPYSLTAVAVDNLNLATTSTAVPVSIVAAGARVNVALATNGATATASSTYTTDYAARAAIDGRRSGAIRGQLGTWEDAGALLPDWFQVTFAAPSSIDQVNIFSMQVAWAAPVEPTPTLTSGLAAENFDIQYWNGADWVVVPGGQVVGNTLVWKQVSFAPITTSALRIAVTKVAGGITRLTEVEAWTAASGVSPPVATLTASPSTIAAGGTATLAWTTSGAASVAIDQGIGAVALSGSRAVTPAATTTYTLTATNAGGATTATAVVTVNVPPPNVPPMVSLTAPGSGSVFTVADAVALRATASDPNGIGRSGRLLCRRPADWLGPDQSV